MNELTQIDFWQRILGQALNWLITSAPTIFLILLLAFGALRFVNYLLGRLTKFLIKRDRLLKQDPHELEKRTNTLVSILRHALRILIWLVFLMLLLREFGVDIAPIIAGAGILGLAVGFGAQNLVRDFISGFFFLLENQIRAGDVAVVNGTGGLVESVNLRTTVLRDLSGTVHIFPNGAITSLSNMTKDWSAMVFDVGIGYGEDVDRVMEIMKRVAAELRKDPGFEGKILEPIEIFGLDRFGDSAVVIKARIKTKPIQQWTVGREYNRRLKRAFDQENVEIPFPQRTLHWGDGMDALTILLKNKADETTIKEAS